MIIDAMPLGTLLVASTASRKMARMAAIRIRHLKKLCGAPFKLSRWEWNFLLQGKLQLCNRAAPFRVGGAVSTKPRLDAFCAAIAAGAFAHMWFLSLERNRLGDAQLTKVARALASCPMRELTHLDLGAGQYNRLMAANGANPFPKAANIIADDGMAALCQASADGGLPRLEVLDVFNNQIGKAGARALADACARGAMARLRELWLNGNMLDDEGVGALSAAPLPSLETLCLSENPFGRVGVSALCAALPANGMPSLRRLHLPRSSGGLRGVGISLTNEECRDVRQDLLDGGAIHVMF